MDDRIHVLSSHYGDGTSEDKRFSDRSHSVEYLTTKRYIDKYLKPGDRILEVGAGTGAYSIHYASLGYRVNAIEFVNGNLNVLRGKITDDMNIVAEQGDALDLSRFDDNTFDITLVFGPLYHLFNEQDIRKAIEEAIRVTKKNGLIYLAYLTNDSVFVNYCLKKGHLLDKDIYDKNYKLRNDLKEVFSVFYIDEFKKIMSSYNIEYLHNVASDGLSSILKEYINNLSDEEFRVWLDYHYSSCEREDLQGYSSHMLYLCRKK